jgi:hypothetical protein
MDANLQYLIVVVVFILALGFGQRDIEGPAFSWRKFFKVVGLTCALFVIAVGGLYLVGQL